MSRSDLSPRHTATGLYACIVILPHPRHPSSPASQCLIVIKAIASAPLEIKKRHERYNTIVKMWETQNKGHKIPPKLSVAGRTSS